MKYLLFTCKLDFYSDYIFYRGRPSCLICLMHVRSYTALPVNYKSVLQLEQKNYVRPLEFGGLNPSFFVIWERGLAPPSPYVEPPLAGRLFLAITSCYVYSLPPCYFTQSALPIYQTGCCSVSYTCDLSRVMDFARCRLFAQLGHTFVLVSGDR